MKKYLFVGILFTAVMAYAQVTTSPNMGLPVPQVGVTPGPAWAENINSSLNIIDAHDHTPGNGVAITPSAMDITSDLAFNNHNATLLRSTRYQTQSSPLSGGSDLGATYVSGVDLYYNDGNGNQVRITQGGSVTGATGSITGLVAPASASYSSGSETFVWQSDVNKAANMDARSYILRNSTTSSNGLTLTAPTLTSDYAITLPLLPAATNFMLIDVSGNITAPWHLDNSTLGVVSNLIKVLDQGITATQIANNTITNTQIASKNLNYLSLAAGFDGVWNVSQVTSTGTFTVPANVNFLSIVACGAGGGGGGGGTNTVVASAGASGGAGSIPQLFNYKVVPGDVLTVNIGAGGTAGTGTSGGSNLTGGVGGNGGSTTITGTGVDIFLSGGAGGNPSTGANPSVAGAAQTSLATTVDGQIGAGGSGAGQVVVNAGTAAANAHRTIYAGTAATGGTASSGGANRGQPGGGGGSGFIKGGNGGNGATAGSGTTGFAAAANSCGGGGGGAGALSNSNGQAGGTGGSGLVNFYWLGAP